MADVLGDMNVPFINLAEQHRILKSALLNACEAVLDHGHFILGPEVAAFERRFADYCGTKYAVGVDNGTNALLLALRAIGIGNGDEVITPVNSFVASASCIALAGAKPILVDVLDNFTIDPEQVERAITGRTKAIIPVHLTGRPADMASILQIARTHGIHVIEDAAQAVGATYNGRRVGSFGTMGCFSLHPLKILNAIGDGGVITTDDPALYDHLLVARNHGLRNRNECGFWSFNSRLDTIQAAMLLVKMDYLNRWIAMRRTIAEDYCRELSPTVMVPVEPTGVESAYQTFVIQCDRRDDLQQFLQARGIETRIHYSIPIHMQLAATSMDYKEGDFPVAESQAKRILSLPIYPELTREQRDFVASSVIRFYYSMI